jgi:ribosomal-protein-alanine N-acetyltransferase
MIIDLFQDDIENINKLENSFEKYFINNKIIDDLNQNIFSKYFIYMEKSNIISFVNYYDLYDRFEIVNIEVLEEFRNNKIASKMMEHLIKIGEDKNIVNITLEVRIDNINALRLYRKYGFKEVAIREKYYDGIDAYLMERKMM